MKTLKVSSPFSGLVGSLALTFASLNALAVDGTWTSLTNGNWSEPGNWSGGIVADGPGGTANLIANFTSPITITLDGNRTLGSLNYNDSGGNPDVDSLTITASAGVLTLEALAGSPDINVSGTNSLILDVVLAGSQGLHVGKTGAGNDSRIYLNQKPAFTGDVLMRQGRLYLNAGNNTLPGGKVFTWISGTGGARLYLNGHTQEVAGLSTTAGDLDERVYNDSPTPGMLILNVPGTNYYDFSGARLGFNNGTADENNFSVVKEGTGTQTINQNGNGYAGETIVNNGILDVNNAAGSLGSAAVGTTVNPGGTLRIRGSDAIFPEPLILKGAGFGGTNGALNIAGGGGGIGTGPGLSGLVTLGANATINTELNLMASGGISDFAAGFGFTKTGPGALNLGSCSVGGASFLNQGTLGLAAGSSLASLTLANGATLNVSNQVAINTLTFTGPSAVVNIHYGDVGGINPSFPVINDSSFAGNVSLTQNGVTTINITAAGLGPTAGTPIPLIDFGARAGSGTFVLGDLPPGVIGSLGTNGTQIVLNISAVVNQLTWSGSANGDWDLMTLNWNSGTAKYQETSGVGDLVTFDDTALTTSVNLTTTVSPALMTVNNGGAYSFGGAGKISGGAILRKFGGGSLALNTANDYANGTRVFEGSVLIGNNAALGSGIISLNQPGGFGTPVICSDGATARSLPNGLTFVNTGLGLPVAALGDVTRNGALTFSGPVNFSGSAPSIVIDAQVTWSGTLEFGSLNKLGTNTLTINGPWANLTEPLEVREGTVIFDGITITNLDTIRADAENLPGSVARMIVRNGASITTLGPNNNMRVGYNSTTAGTNLFDLAGTWRMPNAGGGAGGLHLERESSLYSEFNLLAGGDLEVFYVRSDGTSPGVTRFNFDGGILRARADSSTFMDNIDEVYILNGGAIISTEGYNVTIPEPLLAGGSGGVTKLGSGILTLTGSNNFTGNILVNAGGVAVGSAHAGSGSVTVADGGLLGFLSEGAGQTVRFPGATLGGVVGGTLECSFNNQAGIPAAPAGYATNLTLNGTITVNVRSLAAAQGNQVVPLVGYNSLSGAATLVTGILPQGIVGTVTNNTATKQIELVISTVMPLLWTGAESAFWDIGISTNWTLAGAPEVFEQGGSVRFDDSALQHNVYMIATLAPAQVVFSNNSVAYTLNASGGTLDAGATVIKEGTNMLTLASANTFSGAVIVKQGTLRATDNSALGSAAVGTVVSNGATLDLSANFGQEPFTVSGSGVDGLGAIIQTLDAGDDVAANVFMTGDTTLGSYAARWDIQALTGSDAGLQGAGFKLTKVGPADLRISGGENPDNENPPYSLTNIWETGLGDIDVQEGQLSFERRIRAGLPGANLVVRSNATLLLNSTSVTNSLGDPNVFVKNLFMTNATLTLTSGVGTNDAGAIFGGPVLIEGLSRINSTSAKGAAVTAAISGPGSLVKIGAQPVDLTAVNTYSGSTMISNGVLRLGPASSINNSPAIFIDADGTFDVSQITGYTLGGNQTLSGFGSVNGSVLSQGTVAPGDSIGTLTFSNSLTLAGTTVMELTRDGGLTNDLIQVLESLTYGGILQLQVTGLAALEVNDTFTLFSFVSAPGGSFSQVQVPTGYSFDTSQLGVDGTVKVTGAPPTVPTQPTNFVYSVVGGQITLSWPSQYTGWYLQAQTNSLAIGLGANWVTVPGSNGTNSFSFPVDPANGTVFYRMSLQP